MSVLNDLHYCDFCGKSQEQVKRVIAQGAPVSAGRPKRKLHDGVDICNECIDLCVEILYEEKYDFSTLQIVPKDVVDMLGFKPVFQGRNFKPTKNACFYLGPFKEPFNTIYRDHIEPTLRGADLNISRADEIFSTNVIIEDVWKGIASASFIVADVSGRNPNVMYEIGMAHTIGRPVLLISQSADDLPFDLRHRRCVIYDYTPRGCRKLEEDLLQTAEFVRSLTA